MNTEPDNIQCLREIIQEYRVGLLSRNTVLEHHVFRIVFCREGGAVFLPCNQVAPSDRAVIFGLFLTVIIVVGSKSQVLETLDAIETVRRWFQRGDSLSDAGRALSPTGSREPAECATT
jgi:hypothetical protein